jgi:hypothetical protein
MDNAREMMVKVFGIQFSEVGRRLSKARPQFQLSIFNCPLFLSEALRALRGEKL